MAKLNAITEAMEEWEKMWKELVDTQYELRVTVDVDALPYYKELPNELDDLRNPAGRLKQDQDIVVVYPQWKRCKMIWMKMRTVKRSSGEINTFYVPIRSYKLDQRGMDKYVGIDVGESKQKFVTNFRMLGDDDDTDNEMV